MTAAALYAALSIGGGLLGFGAGYVVFSDKQVDLSEIKEICGNDRICAQYTACLVTNSRESGGQNPRNCDALLEVVNFSERNRILQGAFDYCEKKDGRDAAALCREYVRPK